MRRGYAWIFVVLVTALACDQRTGDKTDDPSGALLPRVAADDVVLASVNGVAVLASDVAAAIAAETGDDALREEDVRAALSRLIVRELLAQDAVEQGHLDAPRVAEAWRRALAYRLTVQRFADGFTEQDIPQRLLKRAYDLNIGRFVHPELVRVTHFVAATSEGMSDEDRQRAEGIAQEVRHAATRAPLTVTQFRTTADQIGRAASDVTTKTESLVTPEQGYTVRPFAEAAFALRQPGAISPVIETRFGFHVIYLEERMPAKNISLAEADTELRAQFLDEARSEALDALIQQVSPQIGVEVFTETLADVLKQLDAASAGAASS